MRTGDSGCALRLLRTVWGVLSTGIGGGEPIFYFDVGSPYAWLSAERVDDLLDPAPSWRPVLLGALFKQLGRGSWARTDARRRGMAEIESRAVARGLPPVRWPYPWPNDGLAAMRIAAYAELVGAARAFALAAFRVHFVEGHALSEWYALARAVSAAGLSREAMEAPFDPEVKRHLRRLTEEASAAGVFGVPTVAVAGERCWGDDGLDALAARLRRR